LTSFHAAFNSFCKDYFSAEYLYEKCHDEFSLLHKDSYNHESHICDEAFIIEENIYHEDHEVLNDIHYDRSNIEMSSIISDVFVVLNFHEDQHISFEYSDDGEKVCYVVDISPDYNAKIYDKLVIKAMEYSSMFFPSFLELKEDFVCCSYEGNAKGIPVLKHMFLAALLMMKKLFQILTKNNHILSNIPTKIMKSRVFSWLLWNLVAWFLYMIMKDKRKS
jgi:hypothetical protein